MKLSKDDLRRALQGEEETFDFVPNRFSEAVEALNNGTLEIEGYERVQWTRFNPNDPKTFPPKDEYFDVFIHSITHDAREVNKLNEFWWKQVVERWVVEVRFNGIVIYWRPLPKPPVESEVK